jgi:hypothetical protein
MSLTTPPSLFHHQNRNKNMTKSIPLTRHHLEQKANCLRYEAYLAYLDGRNKRSLDLNKKADALSAQARKFAA